MFKGYDVTIDFNEDPTGATAATAQNLCGVKTATLNAIGHSYELGSEHAGSATLWTKVSGPGAVAFSDNTIPGSDVTVSLYGTYVLRWTETNGTCSRDYDVTLDFNEDPTGATAATAQNLCGVKTATLNAIGHSYELGSEHAGSATLWTKVSGPGAVAFSDNTIPGSDVTVSLYGTYVLRWTETNGTCSRDYDVTIDFNEDPTGATAATAQNLCAVKTATLNAIGHSYELGSEHAGSATLWTKVSGPGAVAFSDNTIPGSDVTVSLYGTYILRWTETNGTCSRDYDVTIDFNEDPTGATAATAQNLCGVKTATLNAIGHSYELGSEHAGSATLWTKVSGPGAVAFSDNTIPGSDVTVSLYGTYILRWTETNGTCSRDYDVTLDFNEDPTGAPQPRRRTSAG